MLPVRSADPIKTRNSSQHSPRRILLRAIIRPHARLEIAPRIIPAADVPPVCAVLINLTTFLQTQLLAA
jgi:hypothetical protein